MSILLIRQSRGCFQNCLRFKPERTGGFAIEDLHTSEQDPIEGDFTGVITSRQGI